MMGQLLTAGFLNKFETLISCQNIILFIFSAQAGCIISNPDSEVRSRIYPDLLVIGNEPYPNRSTKLLLKI